MPCVRRYSSQSAQTFAFLTISLVTIFLLVGLAIDSGLLYLAQARLSRSLDAAALASMANASSGTATTTQQTVDTIAILIRNFSIANYADLSPSYDPLQTPGNGGVPNTVDATTGIYEYKLHGVQKLKTGGYARNLDIQITVSPNSLQVTSATISGTSQAPAFFMPYFAPFFGSDFSNNLVYANTSASRNPRLIVIVLDRSGSMLKPGGGAYSLPDAVNTFLNGFQPGNDNIGIVSFSSMARVEMPMTTNFRALGTNILSYCTATDSAKNGIPGVDPEASTDPAYSTAGVRRLKFGGDTSADEGFRLGMELLVNNPNYSNIDFIKYLVFFTDGKFNTVRTLLAAPSYINVTVVPTPNDPQAPLPYVIETNFNLPFTVPFMSDPMSLRASISNPVATPPTKDIIAGNYNYEGVGGAVTNGNYPVAHTNDFFQSIDSYSEGSNIVRQDGTLVGPIEGYPAARYATTLMWVTQTNDVGAVISSNLMPCIDTNGHGLPSFLNPSSGNSYKSDVTWKDAASFQRLWGQNKGLQRPTADDIGSGHVAHYNSAINVWIPPGAVDYVFTQTGNPNSPFQAYVSDAMNATLTMNLTIPPGGENMLVVPGYILDGTICDSLSWYNATSAGAAGTPELICWEYYNFSDNGYQWPDSIEAPFSSQMRALLFRNYPNLLTGYSIFAPYDPSAVGPFAWDYGSSTTNAPAPGPSPQIGLGMYYPSAPVLFPFDRVAFNPNLGGTLGDFADGSTYPQIIPNYDAAKDIMTNTRHYEYTTNMGSEVPQYAGEIFYVGPTKKGAKAGSSTMITDAKWMANLPAWANATVNANQVMVHSANYYGNLSAGNPNIGDAWYPQTYNGYIAGRGINQPNAENVNNVSPNNINNSTGGYEYVTDSQGTKSLYRNAMCYSGRPTHYYDFSTGQWQPITNQGGQLSAGEPTFILNLCNWKVSEYAAHLRMEGVKIFTVGFGNVVDPAQQLFLAQLANATNFTDIVYNTDKNGNVTTAKTFLPYNPLAADYTEPVGAEYYEVTNAALIRDFSDITKQIEAYLSQ